MKNLIIVLLIACSSLVAYAQEETNKNESYVGANAGFTTGYGFAYKFNTGNIGVQASVLPIKMDDFMYISIGLTGYYYLNKSKYHRTYLFIGNHFITSSDDTEDNIGFGGGFSVGKDVMFNCALGYGVFDITDTFSLLPTIEIGVSYKLKSN